MGASSDLALPSSHLNRLLTAYLSPYLRFEEAAESLDLTLLDFIAQLEHPDVERALARIAAAKARRAEHLALNAHDSAIAALVRLIESGKATGPVRAAAASLLRRIREATTSAAIKPPPPRGEGRGEGLGNPNRTSRAPLSHRERVDPPKAETGEGHCGRVERTTTRATEEPSPVPPRHEIGEATLDGCPGQQASCAHAASASAGRFAGHPP